MEFHPLISVVIPHYNNHDTVLEATDSVLNQTYGHFELIIIDSSKLGREYFPSDDRIKYYQDEPSGVASALNFGIEKADGDYICILGADDKYVDHKLQHQVSFMEKNDFDISYTNEWLLKDGNKEIWNSMRKSSRPVHIDLYRIWGGVSARTVMIQKDCLRSDRFDETLFGYEDYHLWVRLFRGYNVGRIDRALSCKRIQKDSLSTNTRKMYESGVQAINDLASSYSELEDHRRTALNNLHWRTGKSFLDQGEYAKAREAFQNITGYNRHRLMAAIASSLLVMPIDMKKFICMYKRGKNLW